MCWPCEIESRKKLSVLGLEKRNGPRSSSVSRLKSFACEAVSRAWLRWFSSGKSSLSAKNGLLWSFLGVCGRAFSGSFVLFSGWRTLWLRSFRLSFATSVLFQVSYLDDHFSGRTYPGQSSALRVHWLHCGKASSHLIFLCLQRRQPPKQRWLAYWFGSYCENCIILRAFRRFRGSSRASDIVRLVAQRTAVGLKALVPRNAGNCEVPTHPSSCWSDHWRFSRYMKPQELTEY